MHLLGFEYVLSGFSRQDTWARLEACTVPNLSRSSTGKYPWPDALRPLCKRLRRPSPRWPQPCSLCGRHNPLQMHNLHRWYPRLFHPATISCRCSCCMGTILENPVWTDQVTGPHTVLSPPISRSTPLPISFNNVPVAEENEIRLLGAILDRQLSFRSHLRSITYKANQRMHFFKKVAPLLNMAGKLCLYKGFVRPTMEYSILTWMGASESSLKQLDRVQHRALRLIGPGVVLPHLSHRRMVGALCYMCKLHSIPSSHPVASLLPGPAVAAPNPRTRRSSIARHPHQLQHDHPARTASWNLRRLPNAASKAWNVVPPSLLQHRPELKKMQAFKDKINRHLLHSNWLAATDSLWLFPCCYLLTAFNANTTFCSIYFHTLIVWFY